MYITPLKYEMPLPRASEKCITEWKAPPTVCETSELAPLMTPIPPSSGPSIKPNFGSSYKSLTPFPICLIRPADNFFFISNYIKKIKGIKLNYKC